MPAAAATPHGHDPGTYREILKIGRNAHAYS